MTSAAVAIRCRIWRPTAIELELPFWAWPGTLAKAAASFSSAACRGLDLTRRRQGGMAEPADMNVDRSMGARLKRRATRSARGVADNDDVPPGSFLADLFIHGIGGGIYDELTDPPHRTLLSACPRGGSLFHPSATLLLPLPRYADAAESSARELAKPAARSGLRAGVVHRQDGGHRSRSREWIWETWWEARTHAERRAVMADSSLERETTAIGRGAVAARRDRVGEMPTSRRLGRGGGEGAIMRFACIRRRCQCERRFALNNTPRSHAPRGNALPRRSASPPAPRGIGRLKEILRPAKRKNRTLNRDAERLGSAFPRGERVIFFTPSQQG